MSTREIVFTRFERFWHWFQAVLIILLMVTGFEVNGAYALLGYEEAAAWHRVFAWTLIGLWVFAVFWHLVTGEWKQYIPTTEKMMAVVRYYSVDIFNPEAEHPWRTSPLAKHNPLQRIAYLTFTIAIIPVLVVTGLLYMYYNDWADWGLEGWSLGVVAGIHTAAAFAMLVFFIAHVYMAFTGRPVTAYLQAMVTGYKPDHH